MPAQSANNTNFLKDLRIFRVLLMKQKHARMTRKIYTQVIQEDGIIFLFTSKEFVRGLTAGAVKFQAGMHTQFPVWAWFLMSLTTLFTKR